MGKRLQSAMEYLMTYGWAILIVAVVLGALYQLGVFGTSTSALAPACLASSGFLCQTPTLNTSGYLAVKFGQIGTSSLTISNLACTTNVTAPSSTTSVGLTLTSGETAILAFSCPLTSNSLGSAFKGYLWLTYNTPTQSGVVDRIAVVTSRVSTTGNVIAILGGGPSAGGNLPPSHYIYCTGGFANGGARTGTVYYAPLYTNGAVGTWASSNSYSFAVSDPYCVASNGYEYCVGGYDNGIGPVGTVNYAYLYGSAGVSAWASTNSYPISVQRHSCTISGGYIYCFVGNNGASNVNNVYYSQVFTGALGSWSSTNNYPLTTEYTSCTSSGGYAYCVSGLSTSAVYGASLSSGGVGTWSSTTSYPFSLTGTACTSYNAYDYCIGGDTGSSISNVYYGPVSGGSISSWTSANSYPLLIEATSCTSYNGYVYCMGGFNNGPVVSNVYYAPLYSNGAVGAWTTTNSYPIGIDDEACVAN